MNSTLTPEQIALMKAQSRVPAIIVSTGVCFGITSIAVFLRFLTRHIAKISFGADDWLILVAWFLFAGYTAASVVMTHYGMGRHSIFVTEIRSLSVSLIAVECCYNASIFFIKTSILSLYIRLFPQKWLKRTCIGIGTFVFAYSFPQLLLDIFQCTPLRALWNPTVPHYCVNLAAVIISGGVLNIVTDFVMLSLPLPVVWSLQISKYKKRLLSSIFLIGGLACIASIVRLFYASQIDTSDSTYNDLGGLVTSSVEVTMGVVAACIPTYRPLLTTIFGGHVLRTWFHTYPYRKNTTDVELITAESTRNHRRTGWGEIKTETSISQVRYSKKSEDREEFGVTNSFGGFEGGSGGTS